MSSWVLPGLTKYSVASSPENDGLGEFFSKVLDAPTEADDLWPLRSDSCSP